MKTPQHRNPITVHTSRSVVFTPIALPLLCLLALFIAPFTALAADRPNIIIIMGDDMGFSDIGCYGGEVQTPNLDALAKNGLRFTQFYNTARCCPTRASLLTGLYAHQAGIGHMMADKGLDSYRGELSRRAVTIAEAVKPAGYRAYAVGKWHVTKKVRPNAEIEKHNWPLQRGFDRHYGTIHGAGSFFDPNSLTRDNELISPYADPEYQPEEYYYTDAISDHAVRFISDHARDHAEKPFFMYVAYTAAHWPIHALERDIAKYRGKYDSGYAPIRAARSERLKELGLVDPKWTMSPQEGDWSEVRNREFEIRCMEVYAAMVDIMDQGIGRIVAELEKQKRLDNTLILYLQDNGACAEGMGRGGNFTPRPEQPTLPPMDPAELQYDMIPKQTRDGFPMRQGYGVLPGAADTYIGYGRPWANVSNTPFREYKHWVHEGGIATPLIAHWPKGIDRGRSNFFVNEPSHLIDLMATCVDLAEANYPREFAGETIQPMEGASLRPLFEGKDLSRSNPLFWEHEGNRAIREGQWKLVMKFRRQNPEWELYDMVADRTEMNDLAEAMPEKVQALSARWDAWAERVGVQDWPIASRE